MQGDASKGSGKVKKTASGWNKDSRMSTSSVLYNFEGAKPEVGAVKVYGLIWGQCSAGLQTAIKGESGYDDAIDSHDVVWFLRNLQKVVSGMDTKANKLYVEQEALVAFTTMRQGATESTDGFITRVKHNAQTLKLAGGERYLYDKDLLSSPTRSNVDRTIEEYLLMHIIRRSDPIRFEDLQKS